VLDLVGLAAAAHKRVGSYSLGMRQRLNLAGALLGDPGALVLDEPANGLDPGGGRGLGQLLRRLASEGEAGLGLGHGLAEMEHMADTFVIIAEGQLRATGSLTEIAGAYHGEETGGAPLLEGAYLQLVGSHPASRQEGAIR